MLYGWLNKEGVFYPAGYESHEQWAGKFLLDTKGLSDNEIDEILEKFDYLYMYLHSQGWVRLKKHWRGMHYIVIGGCESHIPIRDTLDPSLSWQQKKFLEEKAVERGIDYSLFFAYE